MLLKEMNFRDIVDKYLYIDAAGVAQNLGSIFEVTEDATGVLCYCYIDAQAAQNAKIDFVGVTTGTTSREKLESYPHISVLDDLKELLNV